MSVIPLLAASGTIFLDARAHKTIYDGCQVARARGAAVQRFRFEDPDHLDELLRAERDRTRLVCMDGVNSMTGNAPDLPRVRRRRARARRAALRRRRPRLRRDRRAQPRRAVPLRHARQQHRPPRRRDLRQPRPRRRLLEGLLVAAGLHRLPDRGQGPAQGRRAAVPVLGPVAGRVAGHRAGRLRRQRARAATRCGASCYAHTAARARRLERLGVHTPNRSGLPIIEIPLRDHERIDAVGRLLFDRGVYVTLAAYPLVPKDEVGFRVQLTAANTDAEVDMLIDGARGARRPRRAAARPMRAHAVRRRPHDAARCARCASGSPTSPSAPSLTALYVVRRRRSRAAARSSTCSGSVARRSRSSSGLRLHRPASRGPWCWFAVGLGAVLARRPLHLQLPEAVRRARCRSRRSATALYLAVYPALMAGLLDARPPPQPRAGPRRA